MTKQNNMEKVRATFLAARALPAEQRAAFLTTECGDDVGLRKEVEALLAAENQLTLAGPGEEEDDPVPLAVIPGYRVHRILGDGGQGIVYLATRESTGRKVAIKVLKALTHGSPRVKARFEREVSVLAALDHPNVVSIIDRGVMPDGSPFLAMEYINGISLAKWITNRASETETPAGRAKALLLFVSICDAVNAAHLRGITHRDLKPANILVDDRDQPHIVDFGIAHSLLQMGPEDAPAHISLTGQFMGSLPWTSPEQANGQSDKIDPRSDVYSLGVLLYQLVTGGRFPYQVAGTMREVLDNILTVVPPPPSSVVTGHLDRRQQKRRMKQSTGVNRELDAIVLKALAKRRDDRYQNAGELGKDLENYLAGRPGTAPSVRHRPDRPVWAVATAAVGLIALGAAAVTYWIEKSPKPQIAGPPGSLSPPGSLGPAGGTGTPVATPPQTPPVPMPVPVMQLTFDDPSATTRAMVEGRFVDAGTEGVTPVAGKVQGGVKIAANGSIALADRPIFHVKTAVTVAAWIRLPAKPKGTAYVLSKTYAPDCFNLYIADSSVGFSVSRPDPTTDWGVAYHIEADIEPEIWHHVIGRYDGHDVQIYVDGELQGEHSVVDGSMPAGKLQDSTMPLRVGGAAAFELDELNLYDVALTDAQIAWSARGSASHQVPLFDDLSPTEKIAELKRRIASSPVFNWGDHNELRGLYGDKNQHQLEMAEVETILAHSPMDDYMLHILSNWSDDAPDAVKALMGWPDRYPGFPHLAAACWTKACLLETDPARAARLAARVNALTGPEFEVYRAEVAARPNGPSTKPASTTGPTSGPSR